MSFYDRFAAYYDADFADYAEDLLFYREMARRNGGPILELMCGSGRLLLPLVEEGLPLTGVDSSPAMLARAQARLAAAGHAGRVTLIQADVRDADLPAGHFALAFVAVNSFMHLAGIPEQLAALAVARRALRRKGSLIIDLYNPDPNRLLNEDNRLALEHTFEIEGRQVQKLVAVDSDPASQLSYVTYLYDEIDSTGRLSRQQVQFTMRWLYRYELEHLLARAGFVLRHLYGSYDLDAYSAAAPRLIAIANPDYG
jgi:SAM-dependent methyltransferase